MQSDNELITTAQYLPYQGYCRQSDKAITYKFGGNDTAFTLLWNTTLSPQQRALVCDCLLAKAGIKLNEHTNKLLTFILGDMRVNVLCIGSRSLPPDHSCYLYNGTYPLYGHGSDLTGVLYTFWLKGKYGQNAPAHDSFFSQQFTNEETNEYSKALLAHHEVTPPEGWLIMTNGKPDERFLVLHATPPGNETEAAGND